MTSSCSSFYSFVFAALLGGGILPFSHAAAPANLAPVARFHLDRPDEASARMETLNAVEVSGAPKGAGTLFRITVLKASDPFYNIALSQNIPEPFRQPTRLRLRFWGRAEGRHPVRAVVETAAAPWTSWLQRSPLLTPEWKAYELMGNVPAGAANGLHLRFQLGGETGALELAGITLTDAGPDTERIAAMKAVTPDAIQARIEKVRKGSLTVRVVDAHGKPVPGARVTLRQKSHAFLFGCNGFGLNPSDTSPEQKAYQDRFTALFNFATLPFYWGSFEGEPGKPQYARVDAMADWFLARGVTLKGHPLVWHEVYPGWAPPTADAAIPLLHRRVTDLLTHYRGRIRYWDVVNEANASPSYPKTGVGDWARRDGPAAMVATALGWAREASIGAGNTLIYNDFDTSDTNLDHLRELRAMRALPDVIGIQSHMHSNNWPLDQLWRTTERFAAFGLPIHYTETTILSGPRHPDLDFANPPTEWNTTAEGEREQADYAAQFYSVLFSHPAVRAITYWDFSDRGAWLNAPAGFLRKDMSPKPVYTRLMKLIHGDWWTNLAGETDFAGNYKARAFYGDHTLTVRDAHGHEATQTVSLPMGSKPQTITVKL